MVMSMGIRNLFDEYLSFIIKAIREGWDKDKVKDHLFKERVDRNTPSEFYTKISQYNNARSNVLNRNKQYLEMLKERLKNLGKKIITVDVIVSSRLLCDTSSPFLWIPDELGLAWDPILDTPIIPGSEIKGAVAAVVEFEKSSELRNILFGGKLAKTEFVDMKSLIDFTDAYPIDSKGEILERDVMTPIYAREIEEHKASPTPVKFYVIKQGVKFEFIILIDRLRLNKLLENKNYREILVRNGIKITSVDDVLNSLIEILEKIVKKAFNQWGIGSKMSSGYGIFEEIQISRS